jgi:hypothetical protein
MNEELNKTGATEPDKVDPVVDEPTKAVDEPEVDEPKVDNPESDDSSSRDDSVPLKTFLELKSELKEMKRKQAEFEDTKLSESTRTYREKVKQKWIDRGYDEEMAKAMAEDLTEVLATLHAGSETNTDRLIKSEVEELSAIDEFSDIGSYKDRILDTIKKGKTAGLDIGVEQAYFMLAGNAKLKEIRNKETVINRIKNTTKGKSELPTGQSNPKETQYKLDTDDKKALAGLQKMQPDMNWTAKKYMETIKQNE